ncbi:MAG: 16S rRNA processing protein RimM [Acidobacteria bacterium]|nr:16S rRNA processing protein RimM [Acidobacteriota bacterium]
MDDWITLARLVRPRGIRGEVLAESLSNRPDRFSRLKKVMLMPAGRPAEVEAVWWHGGRAVFKFAGVGSISEAEMLRGQQVCVPASERESLPPGEYYQDELIGCEVIDRPSGESLGRVVRWQECGGPPLLEVRGEGGELLIPFAASICVAIEPHRRRIEVALPEGLKDLNRP